MEDATMTGDLRLEPGQELLRYVRHTDLATWNRYAAVNYEFVPIHMDHEAGKAAGYPGAFGMGNLIWAYFHSGLREFVRGRGRIEHVSCQFKAPNLPGEVVITGTVKDVRTANTAGCTVNIELRAASGDSVLATGGARVLLEPVDEEAT